MNQQRFDILLKITNCVSATQIQVDSERNENIALHSQRSEENETNRKSVIKIEIDTKLSQSVDENKQISKLNLEKKQKQFPISFFIFRSENFFGYFFKTNFTFSVEIKN